MLVTFNSKKPLNSSGCGGVRSSFGRSDVRILVTTKPKFGCQGSSNMALKPMPRVREDVVLKNTCTNKVFP